MGRSEQQPISLQYLISLVSTKFKARIKKFDAELSEILAELTFHKGTKVGADQKSFPFSTCWMDSASELLKREGILKVFFRHLNKILFLPNMNFFSQPVNCI